MCFQLLRSFVCLSALETLHCYHRGSVASGAVHPSGKLALTVGRDRTIRLACTVHIMKLTAIAAHGTSQPVNLLLCKSFVVVSYCIARNFGGLKFGESSSICQTKIHFSVTVIRDPGAGCQN